MNTRVLFTILAVIFVLAGIFFVSRFFLSGNISLPGGNRATAEIKEQTFTLEVSETPEAKQIGLSNKKSLGDDQGMLFIFDEPDFYPFWMKNMNFPLDIIYIRDDTIVTIHRNIPAPEGENDNVPIYMPTEPADKVLEINAGLSERHGFEEGDTVNVSL